MHASRKSTKGQEQWGRIDPSSLSKPRVCAIDPWSRACELLRTFAKGSSSIVLRVIILAEYQGNTGRYRSRYCPDYEANNTFITCILPPKVAEARICGLIRLRSGIVWELNYCYRFHCTTFFLFYVYFIPGVGHPLYIGAIIFLCFNKIVQ